MAPARSGGPDHGHSDRLLRLLLTAVAVAAGLTGAALLIFPGATHRYFSWGLAPPALAALMGGVWLASMAAFAVSFRATWTEIRGLVAGTLAFSIPILAVTLAHLDVFGPRWQAWAWIVVFVASPIAFGSVLHLHRGRVQPGGPALPAWARASAGLLALAFLALAVAIWWSPIAATRWLPFDAPALGGRVLGCWASFLAFLTGWAAVRGRWNEARIPLLTVAALFAGAVVGSVRSMAAGFQPADTWAGYLLGLAALLVFTALLAAGSGAGGRAIRRT